MRLFIALDLQKTDDYVEGLKQYLKQTGIALSTGSHLTLKFLGEADDETAEKIKKKLSEVSFSEFELKTEAIGQFPLRGTPRVIWLGVEENKEIYGLRQRIEHALSGFGFPQDFRFHPHITLGRIKFLHDKYGFMQRLKAVRTEPKKVKVDSFKLFESVLTQQGPVYKTIASFSGNHDQKL